MLIFAIFLWGCLVLKKKKELFINFGNCWYFLGCMLGNSGIFWWFTVKLAFLRGRVNAGFQHMYK